MAELPMSGNASRLEALKAAMGKPKIEVSEAEMAAAENELVVETPEELAMAKAIEAGDVADPKPLASPETVRAEIAPATPAVEAPSAYVREGSTPRTDDAKAVPNKADIEAAEMSGEEIGGLPITPHMMMNRRLKGEPYHPAPAAVHTSAPPPTLEKKVMIPETEDPLAGMDPDVLKMYLRGEQGFVRVLRTWKDGAVVKSNEILEEDKIDVRKFVTSTATVGHSASMSINMGDFENVKIQVSVFLPCYVEELNEAYKAAQQMVDMRLNKQVADVKSFRDKKRRELGG